MKYHIDFDLDFKRNTSPGKFIAIEGIDGSGKTTQANRLKDILSKKTSVFLTKQPTDGPIGKFIRQVISGELKLPPVSFQYLFAADRQVHQVEVLKQLEGGKTVITDRYFWSAIAYGLYERGSRNFEKDGKQLLVSLSLLSMYHQFVIPDATFYLDISAETAMKRVSKMKKELELYEKKEALNHVRRAYRWIIDIFDKENIVVIDGEQPVDKVTEEILRHL
ncbi:dTMP kinase [Candidatus Roizmanbacteria bacterium]|nr:dTMP kinase [Candidatus Roizmanbacteria bacterium]